MLIWTGLMLLLLGVIVWFFGNRLWLMGAGAGALLGIGLLRFFPGMADGLAGFFLVAGLAAVLAVLGFIGKAFAKIVAFAIGFIAGGGIVMGLLDVFGASLGFMDWIIALVGGGIGALLFWRYFDWGLVILASLVGSVLVVRGAMAALLPALSGPLGGLLVLVLTVLGIYYHYRRRVGKPVDPSGASNPDAA